MPRSTETTHETSAPPPSDIPATPGGIGDVSDCEQLLSPKDFTTVGATFESCRLVATPTGQPIVEVGYDKLDYDENPIVRTK